MRTVIKGLILCVLLLVVAIGACGAFLYFRIASTTSNSNKTAANANSKSLVDQAAEAIFGTEKTGIAQCDEILAELDKPPQNGEESLIDRGKREVIKQGILSQVRSASSNKTPQEKAEIGKYCAEVAKQLKPTASPAKK